MPSVTSAVFLLLSVFTLNFMAVRLARRRRHAKLPIETAALVNKTERPAQTSRKWAVLIGIDHYQGSGDVKTPRFTPSGAEIRYSNLDGCVNDAIAMEQYLVHTIGVNPDQLTKLLAPAPGRENPAELAPNTYKEPTYSNIVNALAVPNGSNAGDFVYIHFSGHGARATTIFPGVKGDDPDTLDEALVPSDITFGGDYIRDLHLVALVQKMVDAGLVVTVVLDCCHSGGAVRGDENPQLGATRGIPEIYQSHASSDMLRPTGKIATSENSAFQLAKNQNVFALAACQAHQTARERRGPDGSHGLLTYWLLDTLRLGNLDLSSQAIFGRVCGKVQDDNLDQMPYFVGDDNRFFFSSTLRARVYSLTVRRASVEHYKGMDDRMVTLGGGRLHGVEVGSEYAILPWGFDLSGHFDEAHIIGRVQVRNVTAAECRAMFVQPDKVSWDSVVDGCPAVLQALPIAKRSIVYFKSEDEDKRREFQDSWNHWCRSGTRLIVNTDNESNATYTVTVMDGQFKIHDRSRFYTAKMGNILRKLPVTDPGSFASLIRRLDHLARFTITRNLANPGTRSGLLASLISVAVEAPKEPVVFGSDEEIHPAKIRELSPGAYEVEEMAAIVLRIKNNSPMALGCVVLDCSSELSVDRIHPDNKPFRRIEAHGEEVALIGFEIVPELRGRPEDHFKAIDTVKILVCNPERSLDALGMQSLFASERAERGHTDGGLEGLLEELDDRRHGINLKGDSKKALWDVVDLRFHIKQVGE